MSGETNQMIAISGELGSGKTSVANELARLTGRRVVSGGDMHRAFAGRHGISTVELNLRAERDPEIDDLIDGEWARLADSSESLIFDSRLAWHFVPRSLSVHLVVDSNVAADRLFSGRRSAVEAYTDVSDAASGAFARQASERRRFLDKYGVDIWRLSNYDLVVDTTHADIADVSAIIHKFLETGEAAARIYADPRRLLPTAHVTTLIESHHSMAGSSGDHVGVGYVRPFFFVLHGHQVVSDAARSGAPLVPVDLYAEADDEIPEAGGITAQAYLEDEVNPSWVYDWEDAHGFRFLAHPSHSART
jgi:predicted cytidylate kinase